MINVAIYGNYAESKIVKRIIETLYNRRLGDIGGERLNVVAIVGIKNDDNEDSDVAIISLSDYIKLYREQVIQVLIVPIDNYVGADNLIMNLLKLNMNLEDIYCCGRITEDLVTDERKMDSFILPYLSTSYFPYFEFHVADHCNLNCKACEHYSGLVKGERYPDFDKFSKDFNMLKSYIDDIGVIRILGGEPLLNQELEKYLYLVREKYPYSHIYIVTNGLLIRSMKTSLIDAIKKNNILMHISFYPPLEDKMKEILNFLEEQEIVYTISEINYKFTKKQTLIKQPDSVTERIFYNCLQANCHNLYDGKIATCFLPFTTKYFNEYFKLQLPEDEAIDLYNIHLTLEEIKLRMLVPFERCRYCTNAEEIDWDIIHKPSCLEDWIVSKG